MTGNILREHGWLARIWIVAAVFAAITVARSIRVDIPMRDPHGSILVGRIAVSVGLFLLMALIDALWRSRRSTRSFKTVIAALTARWPRRRLILAAIALLAYHLVYFCYKNLKSWDVLNTPRDDMLLRWDRWLFFGHTPAVLMHDLLGTGTATYILASVYQTFSAVFTVSLIAAVVFVDRIRESCVFLASAIWVWILGVASYYLIPSLGPFYSAPEHFDRLAHTRIQDTQQIYLSQRAQLLADPQAHDAFAQVSAFASLHVAVTVVVLLMARYYQLRRASIVLTVYVLATILATIHLGWHFVVDDIAGLGIGLAATLLGRYTVYPTSRGGPVG